MIRNLSVDRNDYIRYIGMNVRNSQLYIIGVVKDVENWIPAWGREEVLFRLDNDELVTLRQIAKINSEIILSV